MKVTAGKLASLVVLAVYLVATIVVRGLDVQRVLVCLLLLAWPMAFIWFPERIGGYTGFAQGGKYIDKPTPPILVSIMGWFFLLVYPFVLYVLSDEIFAAWL